MHYTFICETTPGVRGFSGYVQLPNSLLDNAGGNATYTASMFFWYIGQYMLLVPGLC